MGSRKGLFLPAILGRGSETSQKREDICIGPLKMGCDHTACPVQEDWGKVVYRRCQEQGTGRGPAGDNCPLETVG